MVQGGLLKKVTPLNRLVGKKVVLTKQRFNEFFYFTITHWGMAHCTLYELSAALLLKCEEPDPLFEQIPEYDGAGIVSPFASGPLQPGVDQRLVSLQEFPSHIRQGHRWRHEILSHTNWQPKFMSSTAQSSFGDSKNSSNISPTKTGVIVQSLQLLL